MAVVTRHFITCTDTIVDSLRMYLRSAVGEDQLKKAVLLFKKSVDAVQKTSNAGNLAKYVIGLESVVNASETSQILKVDERAALNKKALKKIRKLFDRLSSVEETQHPKFLVSQLQTFWNLHLISLH
jgi:hypothetical protein